MIRNFSLILLLISCFNYIAQSPDLSLQYYNDGMHSYKKMNYSQADSFYTLSLKLVPHPDTYFNRALSRLKVNNKTGYCEDLVYAAGMGDKEARQLFRESCGTIDTLKTSIKVVTADSVIHSYYHVLYHSQYMNEILEAKHDNQDHLLNITRFKEDTASHLKEEMAEYRGGLTAMMKYMQTNMHYPKDAREEGLSGKVFLKFSIDQSGCIERVVLMKGMAGCPACDKEAIRLVCSMPRWKPAKLDGRPVKVYFTLPISFKIQ